tara:strand:- start:131 stop:523 length:393 start_codon:yes stop_codon:yes gene_type:complete
MQAVIEKLRKEFHQQPELSGIELRTAKRIKSLIGTSPSNILIEGLGGHGLTVVQTFSKDRLIVMIRCELDALPIHEEYDLQYKSTIKGVSHQFGHDGHKAIIDYCFGHEHVPLNYHRCSEIRSNDDHIYN